MSTKTRAAIEDLYKVEGKAELVNGEIVEMPPAGDDPGRASLKVAARLLSMKSGQGAVGLTLTARVSMFTFLIGGRLVLMQHGTQVPARAWSFWTVRLCLQLKYEARPTTARQPNGL